MSRTKDKSQGFSGAAARYGWHHLDYLAGAAGGRRSVRRPLGPIQEPSSTSSGVIQANWRSKSVANWYFDRPETAGPRGADCYSRYRTGYS